MISSKAQLRYKDEAYLERTSQIKTPWKKELIIIFEFYYSCGKKCNIEMYDKFNKKKGKTSL